jgi:Four helix bundle sensory module for signal transduction
VRDLLLEPDPTRADVHRNELNATHDQIESMIAAYKKVLRGEEEIPFQQFTREVVSYFDSLRPALQWNSSQRRQFGYSFMKNSLLPKRMMVVRLADQTSQLNQEQMETGSKRVAALF